MDKDRSVINVGHGGGKGALAIITGVASGKASLGALLQEGVEMVFNNVEGEGAGNGSKSAALSMTFFLTEVGNGACGCEVVAFVGLAVKEIVEGEESLDVRVVLNEVSGGLPGGIVEHVFQVEKKEDPGRVGVGLGLGGLLGAVDESADLCAHSVNHELKAPLEGDAILAVGVENLGKSRS